MKNDPIPVSPISPIYFVIFRFLPSFSAIYQQLPPKNCPVKGQLPEPSRKEDIPSSSTDKNLYTVCGHASRKIFPELGDNL
jgi:hypothetical protein